ncbi:MAG: hypothetical protein ABGX22_28490 [Pirellulaceae bacterium]
MDQLKTAGVWMKRNCFWVLTGLCVLLSITFWFRSTGTLAGKTSDWTSEIETSNSTVKSIQAMANHANDVTHQKMDERIVLLSNDVYAAWAARYDKQKQYLVWPGFLGDQFLAKVRRLQPIESHVSFPVERELLNSTERNIYRNFINRVLPELSEIVGTPWYENEDDKTEPIVEWETSNQKEIHESRFSWPGREPTTLEILYAQEDLWVLKAVLNVIKNANGDISQRYQAAVKTIKYVDIGRDAIGFGGAVATVSSGSAGGGNDMFGGMNSGGGGGMEEGPGMGMGMGGGAGDGLGEAQVSDDPGDNRYIDTAFQPIEASKLRSAFDSTEASDAYLIVAKRIPIRLGLVVDHRQVPKLLAECGNADMQLEIRQIRIGTDDLQAGRTFIGGQGGAGGGGLFGGGGENEEGGMGGGMEGGMLGGGGESGGLGGGDEGIGGALGGGLGGMGGSQVKLSDESPFDVHVELYGIVYIYNPVDRVKLGNAADAVVEDGGDGTVTTEAAGNEP